MIYLFSAQISDKFTKSAAQKILKALPPLKQKSLCNITLGVAFKASVGGYALLTKALEKLGLENHRLIDIEFPLYQKPYFPQGPDFNISHSHNRIICAISSNVEIGIDMEKVIRLDNYQFINYFNEEELAYIDQNKSHFYEVWTKKEAILKAAGHTGLTQAKKIKFYGSYAVYSQIKWHLHTYEWDDYHIALASSQDEKIEWIRDILL